MIILTITNSLKEKISGIPEYLTVETSVPANIYYTLDGEIPDENSIPLMSERLYLPTNSRAVLISIKAISDHDQSDIETLEFFTKISNPIYLTGSEGISVMKSDSEATISLRFDENGDAAEELSGELQDYDIKGSRADNIGLPIEGFRIGKTTKDFINLKRLKEPEIKEFKSTTNNNNVFFNPSAKFIEIDSTSIEAIEGQSIAVINRPYDALLPTSKPLSMRAHLNENIVSGNLVNTFYNADTGLCVSYYYESRDSRWMVSKTIVEKKTLTLNRNPDKNRYVIRWFEDRFMSKIY